MIIFETFKNVFNRNNKFRYNLKIIINNSIKNVDYSGCKHYRRNSEGNVFFLLFEKWIWAWLNSINTNYTCIFLIIEYICEKEKIVLTDLDFSSLKLEKTTNFIRENVEKHAQEIFTPGSDVFRKMFFATQKSWTKGCISTIITLNLISQKFKIKCDLNFDRGVEDDMRKGIDFILNIDGETKSVQHKSSFLNDEGEYFTSNSLIYNELIYRNNVDLISVQSKNEIYFFKNSKNHNLIGNKNKKFFVYKTEIVAHMSVEKNGEELENLLVELNQLCFKENYIFMFERDNSNENKISIREESGVKTIIFYLNDVEDKNLLSMVKDTISKLQ